MPLKKKKKGSVDHLCFGSMRRSGIGWADSTPGDRAGIWGMGSRGEQKRALGEKGPRGRWRGDKQVSD